MNERIKELIEQATESKGFLTAGDSVKPLPVREFNKEKFAELIVQECAQFIFVLDAEPVSHQSAARMLMNHFGVK